MFVIIVVKYKVYFTFYILINLIIVILKKNIVFYHIPFFTTPRSSSDKERATITTIINTLNIKAIIIVE